MGFRLFGVTLHEGHLGDPPVEGTQMVPYRDLSAVVEEAPYETAEVPEEGLTRYLEVVDAVFQQAPIAPAPLGTVFRSRDAITAWMELHYVAISEALAQVEDRVGARVYICRAGGKRDERDKGADLAAVAAEAFRTLRRRAVSALPLKTEHLTGIVLSSAYLVDRELWNEFEHTVQAEREANPGLDFRLTGPWPPYDFVHMQFGS
jgi:hypothetical protein